MAGCSGAGEGGLQTQKALGVQRPSAPLHGRPHGHCLLQLEPLGLGLEISLGFTPLGYLGSSGGEVPQARAPPPPREDSAPANNGFKAGSQTDFHWITALKLHEELCLGDVPGASGKGSPLKRHHGLGQSARNSRPPLSKLLAVAWLPVYLGSHLPTLHRPHCPSGTAPVLSNLFPGTELFLQVSSNNPATAYAHSSYP